MPSLDLAEKQWSAGVMMASLNTWKAGGGELYVSLSQGSNRSSKADKLLSGRIEVAAHKDEVTVMH